MRARQVGFICQELNTPAGSSSIKGDMWVNSDWATGTDTDYVRTGIWGSVLPEGSDSYIDSQSIFPIISFTNQDGEARLQLWDTTANPDGGWVDLASSESALALGDWNSFEMRVLPESDRIDYIVNGVTIYSWTMPRGAEENISDELWAIYLKGRNNGVTSFNTYWSALTEARLVLDGETLTAAPDGFNILADAVGGITIADTVSVGGGIHAGSGSAVTLAFGQGSGVATSGAGVIGVVSNEGGSVTLNGGSVITSGTGAHGLYATGLNPAGTGSAITAQGTAVAVTGAGAFGAYATNFGTIMLKGGSVSSGRAALVADGGTINATDVALSTTVAANNGNDVGAVTALNGGAITVSGGTITLEGGRMAGLLALSEGAITSENVTISASGDRARGIYASADNDGAGSVTISGGLIETDGLLSHGLFAKRQSGTTADTMASITASDIDISVKGTSANGIYADVGSTISVNDATVTTGGEGGVGLHAQGNDDGVTGNGSISATGVDVFTSGTSAYGAYAELGGKLTLEDGSVSTTGSEAHGLVAAGTAGYRPEITATHLSVETTADDAVGVGISGTGTIRFTNGSISSGGAAIGVEALSGGGATFIISGSALSSDSGTILDVNRELDDGTGVVSLTLSGGTTATGDILDTNTKTTGHTDLVLNGATLTGAVDGVRTFTLSGGATWGATGAGSIGTVSVGTGGGTIAVAADSTVGLSGTLTGSGDLTKNGSGTLLFSGDGRTYTGTAKVETGTLLLTGSLAGNVVINEDGTLQIGNGDETGDLTGATVNNGTLIFARSDDYDYTGALSGDGGLIKRGEGTLLLSGDYSYTGSTTVEGGLVKLVSQLDEDTDLVVDNGTFDLSDKTQTVSGLSGSGGTLALGAAGDLTVNQSFDSAYSGNITGDGSFTKSGSGSLNLTGNSDFTGQVSVDSGRLAINGTMAGGHVTVNSAGMLGGNGTVGTILATSGGIVSPGNSIGTLHVAGDIAFGSGSVYAVEVDADGNSDTIIATGPANLSGGTVSVIAAAGNYRRFTDYVILTADGGVNGTFDDTDVDLPFLDPTLHYEPNTVTLTLERNDVSFASAARTPNQIAVATSLDTMPAMADLPRVVAGQVDSASARAAYNVLSGEIWASTGTILLDQTRRTGEIILGRLQQADTVTRLMARSRSAATGTRGGRTAVWGQAVGNWNRLSGNGNAAHLSQNNQGFITGIDTLVGEWRLGAAIGYSEADIDLATRSSSATAKSTTATAYAGGGWGALRLHLGGSYSWHDIEGDRNIVFPSFDETAKGQYDGKSASLFGEASYALSLGMARIEPFAGINYTHLKTDAFTETGGTSASLTVGKAKREVTYSTLGLRGRADIPTSATATISPFLSAAWQHGFGDDVRAWGTHQFSGGDSFLIEGLPVARNTLSLNAGLEATIAPGGTIGVAYMGNVADRWNDHGVKLGFSYSF